MMITKKTKSKKFLQIVFIVMTVAVFPFNAHAQTQDVIDTLEKRDVFLYQGDLVTLKVYSLTRIAISQPGIVDIANADVNEVLLVGQAIGETPIFIWDEYGKRTIIARVFEEDMGSIVSRLQSLLDAAEIKDVKLAPNPYEGKVVATGTVIKSEQEMLELILDDFGEQVIDMVRVEGDLIQIDVQISELNTTLTKELGFDWATDSADSLNLVYQETLPEFDGNNVENLFKIGDINRTSIIQATVKALIKEGKGRILSKPSIVVVDGEDASFLVGGEIPIRTTTTGNVAGSVQENVTFKEYGIDLTVTPEVKNGKIDILLSVAIRDIDNANAVGDDVAFTTRSADTRLLLNDGQTVVIAGLIKHNESEEVKRVPFISAIPIVGALFRSKITPTANQEQEVVITLTPRIFRQMSLPSEEKAVEDDGMLYELEEELADLSEDVEKLEEGEIVIEEPAVDEYEEEIASFLEERMDKTAAAEEGKEPETMGEEAIDVVTDEETALAEEIIDDENISKAITEYVQTIQQNISRTISFPYKAKEEGWQGTVKLSLTILSDGSLMDATIKESSGYDIFDKDAINTAQILAPFDPFPSEVELEELVVTIPIVYSQEAILDELGLECSPTIETIKKI
ncbi:MAG: TonB family protein [Candidatus Omnitrophica bacterium]|nr:TonB family protein [Candidatus Omnitrophota bacterium]